MVIIKDYLICSVASIPKFSKSTELSIMLTITDTDIPPESLVRDLQKSKAYLKSFPTAENTDRLPAVESKLHNLSFEYSYWLYIFNRYLKHAPESLLPITDLFAVMSSHGIEYCHGWNQGRSLICQNGQWFLKGLSLQSHV